MKKTWLISIPAALAVIPLLTSPASAVKPTTFYKKPAMQRLLNNFFQDRHRKVFLTEGYMTTLQGERGTTRQRGTVSNLKPLQQDYNIAVANQVVLKSIKVKNLEKGQWKMEAELGISGSQGLERVRILPVTVKGNSLQRLRQEISKTFKPKSVTAASTPVHFE